MTEIEKARKRTKKNRKRQTRAKYKRLKYLAELEIRNATSNWCSVKRSSSKSEYFALWLVKKKLEAKGFECRLTRNIIHYDELFIDWE